MSLAALRTCTGKIVPIPEDVGIKGNTVETGT